MDVSIQFDPTKNAASKILLIVNQTNHSEKPITISEHNGDVIGYVIELWSSLGQEVPLRTKTDAEWSREYAFVLYGSKELKKEEKKRYVCKLKDLIPDTPDNDDLARSIIDTVAFGESGKRCVLIEFIDANDQNHTAKGDFNIEKGK